MKIALLAITLCVPLPLAAEDEPPPGYKYRELQVQCNSLMCIAPREEVMDLLRTNDALAAKLVELTKQLEDKTPTCGKVEVVPKKKLPPIKRENDT